VEGLIWGKNSLSEEREFCVQENVDIQKPRDQHILRTN